MDFLAQNMAEILAAVTALCAAIISTTSFLKSLRSEKRVQSRVEEFFNKMTEELNTAKQDTKITREGVVQAFKESIVTKDVKVSINKHVERILDAKLDKFMQIVKEKEERRTKMMYWVLKILDWTAASGKLIPEQRAEVDELLAMIAEEEQIVDTEV